MRKISLLLSLCFVTLTGCTLVKTMDDSSSKSEETFDSETTEIETSESESESETESESESESETETEIVETITEFGFGEEVRDACGNPGTWYYWADQNWEGSLVNVIDSYVTDQTHTVHIEYEIKSGNCEYGLQLFYKNPDLESGKTYNLSFDIDGVNSISFGMNHQPTTYFSNSGKTHFELTYIEIGNQASFMMVVPTGNGDRTFEICNITWEEVAEEPDEPTDKIIYPNGYNNLYFHDEFDGNTLDTSVWGFDIGRGENGWGNSELQYYTNQNHKVANKVLTITAKKQSMGGAAYTSSRLVTKGKVHHTYGYIEARIALPLGTGIWPAFWMMPNNDAYGWWPRSGEIDIMEARGRVPSVSSSALHYTAPTTSDHQYVSNEYNHSKPINKYHVYAVNWEEDKISFYVDNELYYEVEKTVWHTVNAQENDRAPFDQDFYIILNLALGGQFDNYQNPSDSDLPAEMKIDYVRWFTK